ncbi:MAG TPA: winged helix-turn-helix domain-containing protein [Candidatus Bathyarchaeia archaeon]|nr:winged helix-turn-helix domain-containing protein [Candidatus Bathyarchaeia archaeon]
MNAWLTETTAKRRDKLYIISEIMEISKTGALKTQIMYKANLSFAQLNEYLKLLEKINLLKKSVATGKEVYKATEKGLDFLQRHREIMTLLNEDPNNRNGMKIPPEALLRKN